MDRYYLTEGEAAEREVPKERYVSAERLAGFVNTLGQADEPATASFSNGALSGRIAYGFTGQEAS